MTPAISHKSHACLVVVVVGCMRIFQNLLQPARLQKHWSGPKVFKCQMLILPGVMGDGHSFLYLKKATSHERMVGRKPYLLGNLEALRRCFTYTRSFRWCHRYSSSLLGSDEHVQSVHGHRVRLFVTSCLYQQVFWWWLDMALRFERDHLWKASFNLGPWYRWVGQQGGGKAVPVVSFFCRWT